jgi:major type 1 subunit fimbrin (pilin)
MNFKTALLATAIAATGLLATSANAATDGTITITGTVVPQTCQVDGNAYGTSDVKAVTLPSVMATKLNTAGAIAGKTGFSIAVTNCPSLLTSVQTYFSGGNINSSNGNLGNTGTATNVQVQLLNASGAVMDLSKSTATAQNSPSVSLSGGAATLNYSAQYYANGGAAGAGSVTSTVDFTMIYQ